MQFVADDLLVDDVDVREDGLVQEAAGRVARVAVQLIRLRQQLEVRVDVGLARRDVIADGFQLGFEFFALPCDVAELGPYPRGVDAAVGGEVDQVVFLRREPLQLGGGLLLQHLLRAELVVDGRFHERADGGHELGSERDGLVVPLDGFLDAVYVRVRGVAGVILRAAAEEVRVGVRALVDVHQDHAAVGLGFEEAPTAPDGALEVVVVLAAPFVGVPTGVEEFLDAVEELDVDERLVASFVVFTFVTDFTEVVAVSEQLVDLRVGHGAGGPACGGSGEEPAVGEFVGDVLEGHLPFRVQLERELHEWRPFGVDGDRVDLATFDVVGDVEIAERSASERAAVLRFLSHLHRDLSTVLRAAVLVERREQAVHELPDGRGVDGLRRRDKGHAALLEVSHDDGVIDAVAGEAGKVVDDDVVHVTLP